MPHASAILKYSVFDGSVADVYDKIIHNSSYKINQKNLHL
jgi:hypothetical protein